MVSKLEVAIRIAKKTKKDADIRKAVSLTDRAKKKGIIHKNKAARVKSTLGKLFPAKNLSQKPKAPKGKKTTKK